MNMYRSSTMTMHAQKNVRISASKFVDIFYSHFNEGVLNFVWKTIYLRFVGRMGACSR